MWKPHWHDCWSSASFAHLGDNTKSHVFFFRCLFYGQAHWFSWVKRLASEKNRNCFVDKLVVVIASQISLRAKKKNQIFVCIFVICRYYYKILAALSSCSLNKDKSQDYILSIYIQGVTVSIVTMETAVCRNYILANLDPGMQAWGRRLPSPVWTVAADFFFT